MILLDAKSFEDRCDILLESRGISGHTAADRFCSDFKAYMFYFHYKGIGDANHTMSLLENDDNLTDSNILNTNFRCSLNALISGPLRCDPLFMAIFPILMDNNGKGIGAAELALPLIFSDYRFANKSDGVFGEDNKVEIKKNGASLKPVKSGVTNKGLVDTLNKKYFNGTQPGMRDKKKFAAHIAEVKDSSVYADYFAELYVGCDTTELAAHAQVCYDDPEAFNTAVGEFALAQYQSVDDWNNIIYIDHKKLEIVNIADTSDVSKLGLKFTPKFVRKGDTQAIADGYVNVRI